MRSGAAIDDHHAFLDKDDHAPVRRQEIEALRLEEQVRLNN